MSKEVKIIFSVIGYVKQTVKITKKGMTADKLQKLLESGKACTTIQEDGEIILITNKSKKNSPSWLVDVHEEVIGKVIDVDNECTYEDFEVIKN